MTKEFIDSIVKQLKEYVDAKLRGWGLSNEAKAVVSFEQEHMPYTRYSGNQSVDHVLFRRFLRFFSWKMDSKQEQKDESLQTTDKSIVGAINEVQSEVGELKDKKLDDVGAFQYNENNNAFAAGKNCVATGNNSFAAGLNTIASGVASHAEGAKYESNRNTESAGQASHAEGASTYAKADGSHAEGILNIAGRFSDEISTAAQELGISGTPQELAAKLLGYGAHAEGMNNKALGSCSHSEGNATKALANSTHAEGDTTIAFGEASHAEGYNTQAKGNQSHAEGSSTIATGNSAHAEGFSTVASGSFSHAEGSHTEAIGRDSHAEGAYNKAIGIASHAEGVDTKASAEGAHAEGVGNHAVNQGHHVSGKYATIDTTGRKIFQVGIGTSDTNRKDGFVVYNDGTVAFFDSNGSNVVEFTNKEWQAIKKADANIASLQKQVDGEVSSWYYQGAPTLENLPASLWIKEGKEQRHEGDVYTDITTFVDNETTPTAGQSWRWCNTDDEYGTGWHWHKIADSDATKALTEVGRVRTELNAELKVVNTDVMTLRTDLNSGLETTNAKFGPINTKIGTIETDLSKKVEQAEVDSTISVAIQDKADKSEIATLRTDLNSGLETTNAKFGPINTKIGTIETDLSKKVEQAEVDSTISVAIQDKADKSEIATLRTDLNSGLETTNAKFGPINTKIGTIETDLSKKVEHGTVESIAAQQAQQALDGLEIGGRNLFTNSELKHNITGYSVDRGALTLVDGECTRFTTNSDNNYHILHLTNSVKTTITRITECDNLMFSFMMRCSNTTDTMYIQFAFKDANGAVKYLTTSDFNAKDSEWNKVEISPNGNMREWIKNNNLIPSTVSLYFVSNAENATIELYNLKLEQGNKATAWSPAPEDVDSKADAIAADVKTINSSLNTKATMTDLNTVRSRVGVVEESVGAIVGEEFSGEVNCYVRGDKSFILKQTDYGRGFYLGTFDKGTYTFTADRIEPAESLGYDVTPYNASCIAICDIGKGVYMDGPMNYHDFTNTTFIHWGNTITMEKPFDVVVFTYQKDFMDVVKTGESYEGLLYDGPDFTWKITNIKILTTLSKYKHLKIDASLQRFRSNKGEDIVGIKCRTGQIKESDVVRFARNVKTSIRERSSSVTISRTKRTGWIIPRVQEEGVFSNFDNMLLINKNNSLLAEEERNLYDLWVVSVKVPGRTQNVIKWLYNNSAAKQKKVGTPVVVDKKLGFAIERYGFLISEYLTFTIKEVSKAEGTFAFSRK